MPILKQQFVAAEEHIPLPASSDDESSSELSGDEHIIEDPFYEKDNSDKDSDSDEGPEVLTFKCTEKNRLVEKKKIIEVIKVHEDEKKRKRKELHDQYVRQKLAKREDVDNKLLSEDVLEELNDQPDLKIVDDKEKNDTSDKKKGKKKKVETEAIIEEISKEHGSTLFKCKSLPEEDKKHKVMLGNVKTLKDRLLYGDRIRREKSNKDAYAKRKKQSVVNAPSNRKSK